MYLNCPIATARCFGVLLLLTITGIGSDDFAGTHGESASDRGTLVRLRELNPHMDDDPNAWPLKLKSLVDSEYKFFRGTADLFYANVSTACHGWNDRRDFVMQLHGDVHLGNSGTYRVAGSAFDIQFGLVDLDEAIEGPYPLDLLRAAVAVRLAAKAGGRVLSGQESAELTETLVTAYREGAIGAVCTGDLANLHPAIAPLIAQACSADRAGYVAEFVTGDPPRFRPYRGSARKVKDVMKSIGLDEREPVVDALWNYVRRRMAGADQPPFRYGNREELNDDIGDAAHWTRIGSSGSQGLRKYLVLLTQPFVEAGSIILQLKEEPTPAAVRSGLLAPTRDARGRAAHVAGAYAMLQTDPAWLIGWTRIGDKTFLVKPKDAFGEDLDEKVAAGEDGWREAASLMGHAIGIAHRNASRAAGRLDEFVAAVSDVDELAQPMDLWAREMESLLHAHYESLRGDPEVRSLVRQADALIKSATISRKEPGKHR